MRASVSLKKVRLGYLKLFQISLNFLKFSLKLSISRLSSNFLSNYPFPGWQAGTIKATLSVFTIFILHVSDVYNQLYFNVYHFNL